MIFSHFKKIFHRESGEKKKVQLSFSIKGLFEPIIALGQTLFKKRPNGRRNLLLIQMGIFASFWLMGMEFELRYPYMLLMFPGFTGADWSWVQNFSNLKDIFGTLVLLPLLMKKFEIHVTLFNTIGFTLNCAGFLIAAFATHIWHFYLSIVNEYFCDYYAKF